MVDVVVEFACLAGFASATVALVMRIAASPATTDSIRTNRVYLRTVPPEIEMIRRVTHYV